jgi:hypothetical protein
LRKEIQLGIVLQYVCYQNISQREYIVGPDRSFRDAPGTGNILACSAAMQDIDAISGMYIKKHGSA